MRSTVYFKEGKWSIVDDSRHPGYTGYSGYMNNFSSIRHSCKMFWQGHVTHPSLTWKVDVPICSNCHEEVPEDIMGLWTLHNWDAIQEHSADEEWVGRPGQVWEYTPSRLTRPWPDTPTECPK